MSRIFILFFICFSYFSSSQDIQFSHESGFYDNSFYLKITSNTGELYFKTKNNDFIFPDSMLIDTNRTISLFLHKNDSIFPVGSFSYFINFNTNFKVVSLSINNDFLFNNYQGIYMKGPRAYYDTLSNHYRNTNWEKKWERSLFVEVFDEEGVRIIGQAGGLRIFGGMTKYYPEKSLRVISRAIYGKSRFEADIFEKGIKKYKQFVLRHSGNDYRKTRFKDAFTTSLASESGLDIQESSPSHLFVNSEYWGVYNIREKINKYYIDNKYGCGLSGIDILQAYKRVDEGSNDDYFELLDFIKKNDLSEDQHYRYVSQRVDVRNFINFWIHQIFYANHDVRGNIRFWKSDSLDNKFRWIVYDTDLGFGPARAKKNLLKDFTSPRMTDWYNPTWATFLLRNMLKNRDFEKDFIIQSSYLLSSTLSTENIISRINEFVEVYENEMKTHFNKRKRFQSYQGNYNNWIKSINDLKYFAKYRDDYSFNHLEDKFDLHDSYILKIIIEDKNGNVYLNNNKIQSDLFIGKFYDKYDVPIKIIPDIGYSYEGFLDSNISANENDTIEIKIKFLKNLHSDKDIIINELDYVGDCLELYNRSNQSIDLEGWKILDKDANVYTVKNTILQKNRFLVLHYNDSIKKIDSVLYKNIDFKFSSENETITIYDDANRLVDILSYDLDSLKLSYSRNIPYDTFEGRKTMWINEDSSTIGYHNPVFSSLIKDKILLENQINVRKRRIIIYSSISGLFMISLFFLIKKRST